jgi:hypothetical protein
MSRPVIYNKKWSFDTCQSEALKYNTKSEFRKYSGGAYNASRKNGWLCEICSHMIGKKKYTKSIYWVINSKEEALKYTTRTELQKGSISAYRIALKNNWLDEFFPKKIN